MFAATTPRLLVIDNDESIRKDINETASTCGYQVSTATNFDEFREKFAADMGVVIVDLMMPDVDGVEILRFLAKHKTTAGVIVTSVFDDRVLKAAERLGKAQKLWMIGSLTKPFEPDALIELLNNAEPEVRERTRQLRALFSAADLRRAISGNELVVFYQPKVELKTLEVPSVECLVRWEHPQLGMVDPGRFIAMAEQSGLIDELTNAVLDKAMLQCSAWSLNGLDLKVAVNVSTRSLTNLEFPDMLVQKVRSHGIEPGKVILEITESWLNEDTVAALDILTRLRMKGFELAIDDFGTGYSTMSQLKEIPFSELKLDASFVSDATKSKEARAIVESSIELGHTLGLLVVAEGIESQENWDLITSLGCDECQGYFIARPMRAHKVPEWLATWKASRDVRDATG